VKLTKTDAARYLAPYVIEQARESGCEVTERFVRDVMAEACHPAMGITRWAFYHQCAMTGPAVSRVLGQVRRVLAAGGGAA
jgi:hypothetical protein